MLGALNEVPIYSIIVILIVLTIIAKFLQIIAMVPVFGAMAGGIFAINLIAPNLDPIIKIIGGVSIGYIGVTGIKNSKPTTKLLIIGAVLGAAYYFGR